MSGISAALKPYRNGLAIQPGTVFTTILARRNFALISKWVGSAMRILLFVAAILILSLGVARASPMSYTFGLSATGFSDDGGSGASPTFPTVSGTLTFDFDTARDVMPTTQGLTLAGFTFSCGNTFPACSYEVAYDATLNILAFGNNVGFDDSLSFAGPTDFGFFISDFTNNPTPGAFTYNSYGYQFVSDSVALTTIAPIPEPASLGLLGVGLIGIFGIFRRGKLS